MPHLHVSVRLFGVVVDQRLCAVRDEVWLGDGPTATVAFPGASIRVRRLGDRLQVQGLWLDAGQRMRVARGDVEVVLQAVEPRPMPRPAEWVPDLRLLLATAAVVMFGASLDAADAFVHDHPGVLAELVGDRQVQVVVGAPTLDVVPVRAAAAAADALPPEEPAAIESPTSWREPVQWLEPD